MIIKKKEKEMIEKGLRLLISDLEAWQQQAIKKGLNPEPYDQEIKEVRELKKKIESEHFFTIEF